MPENMTIQKSFGDHLKNWNQLTQSDLTVTGFIDIDMTSMYHGTVVSCSIFNDDYVCWHDHFTKQHNEY